MFRNAFDLGPFVCVKNIGFDAVLVWYIDNDLTTDLLPTVICKHWMTTRGRCARLIDACLYVPRDRKQTEMHVRASTRPHAHTAFTDRTRYVPRRGEGRKVKGRCARRAINAGKMHDLSRRMAAASESDLIGTAAQKRRTDTAVMRQEIIINWQATGRN